MKLLSVFKKNNYIICKISCNFFVNRVLERNPKNFVYFLARIESRGLIIKIVVIKLLVESTSVTEIPCIFEMAAMPFPCNGLLLCWANIP